MHPISFSDRTGFSRGEIGKFEEYLLSLCEEHKSQGKALAFAFIVYDFKDYTISKILQDKDYWSALDITSGEYLTIFYINSNHSYYNKRQKEIKREKLRQRNKSKRNEGFHHMYSLFTDSGFLDNQSNFIKENFEIKEELKTPFVIFFQVNNEKVIDSFIITLRKEKVEDSFNELYEHVKNAVEAVSKVDSENYGNHQEIFNLIHGRVKDSKLQKYLKDKSVAVLTIGNIITFIKLWLGI